MPWLPWATSDELLAVERIMEVPVAEGREPTALEEAEYNAVIAKPELRRLRGLPKADGASGLGAPTWPIFPRYASVGVGA
jgi:hypothetical protein